VTVSIPLVDHSSVLDLDRVHNLPLKVKDGYSVIADISTEYLVTDQSQQYFLELYKEDFQVRDDENLTFVIYLTFLTLEADYTCVFDVQI
jgi:hypothetical protein